MDILNLKNRLYARLKEDILHGVYSPGERFPAELHFARELGVARNTLRSALARLESEHLVRRERRHGTIATPDGVGNSAVRRYLFYNSVPTQKYATHVMPSIIQGLERTFAGNAMELDICLPERFCSLSHDEARTIFAARNIRGAILYSSQFFGDEPIYRMLCALEVPTVLAYCYRKDYDTTGFAAIPQNTATIWRASLEYLRKIGHRRIVTVNMNTESIRSIFTPEAYENLLRELGLDPNPALVLRCYMDFNDIYTKFREVFTAPNRPTAVLCYSDFWAPLIYRALQKLNLRIPEDVSVMGYCGSGGSEYMTPPLSTAAILYQDIGQLAMQMLLSAPQWFKRTDADGNPIPPPLEMTPYQLKIRGSTAPITKPTGRIDK